MTGYYTGKLVEGKIFPCKKCGKVGVVGQERFYEKKGDDWLGCIDKECFIAQGGSTEPATKSGGGKFTPNKPSITEAPKLFDLAETFLDSFIKKRKETHHVNPQNATIEDFSTNEESIFILSMFRTLSGNFKP